MKWLWIIPLMVIGFAPVAFGQVVETKGQNYDLIEDFTIGEAKWTTHPERIMVNGEWQNYFLTTDSQKIIFNSNSIGGFIYDIPSCSYSLYENGYDGGVIIPSVSSVATYLKDGTWQNMAVNEESCDVNFSQNENGIFLTSTKIMFRETNEPLFQSYNGTDATIFLNGTSYDVINNGNQTGYYVDNFVQFESEKFTQEIKVDINSGIKETFKVWNESDEQLGISQTVHTGETITVGENTIDIAQFNGQSFDRQFLEDNEAQVFEIANGLNYDFDLGFESLTGINIISESSFFDTTYKVNLDYSNGGFVNYLEIDPTFTTTNHRFYYENDGNSTCNDTSSGASQSTMGSNISVGLSKSTGEDCYRGAVEFDISSISDSAVITDLSLDLNIVSYYNNVGATSNCDIRSLTAVQPTVDNAGTMFTGIDDGTLLLNDDFCKASGGSVGVNTFNLGSTGISEITNQLPNDWFALGFHQDNDDSSGTLSGTPYYVTFNTPELTVTYTVPTAPQPPTNLQTVNGQPIELSWTAPVDDGGSSITGYKVFRTLSEFAMTALPNNGGNSGVDFSNNELLIHGFDGTNNIVDSSPNSLTVTTNSGTTTTGVISNAISTPDLSVTSSLLPDGTDSFTVGGWVKQVLIDYRIFTDDLSSATNWTLVGNTQITNGELDFDITRNTGDRAGVQVGTVSSADDWLLEFKINFDGFTGFTGDTNFGNFGMYQAITNGVSTPSCTTFVVQNSPTTSNTYKWGIRSSNTASNCGGAEVDFASNPQLNTDYYMSLYSDGTTITGCVYTDSARTTLYTPCITTNNDANTNTNYFAISEYGQGVAGGLISGQLDDIAFSKNTGGFQSSSPPTNTKLLGFTNANGDDVAFNVGTTTADFKVNTTPIISATGLTDNTSNFQHYAVTRDGSSWTLYQNGQSVATATDSTDFGTISGAHTIKLDGTIDEYFIDSTALTSSEIDDIYNMGLEPTQIGTSTTTSFDDSNVSGGNTYYYYVKATNAIGDSDFSAKTTGLAGTPPNPPTGLTANIQDVNNAPLDIYLQWSSPTNVGSGTLTGFEVWRDGSLVTTTGLVTSYTDTVSSSGTFSYQVKAVSTHGTSGFSNSASQTTPTVPNAISDLSATVDSDTQISLSWTAPNNGGSAITGYKVFQDGVQIATPTSASHVVTGLTSNTQYTFKVIAVNNVGDSADSNLVTPTTYETIVGSINVSSTVQGATAKLTFTQNVTSGTPTPNFNTFTLKEGTTTIASNISSPYYFAIPDGTSHSYTITSTDNTHWNTPTISGSVSNIQATFEPNWSNGITYNYTRANNVFDLNVNQDSQALWDLNCEYKTGGQILAKSGGINATFSNVWYVSDSQTILDTETVYIECTDADGIVVSITSYGPSRIGGGIALLDNFFEDWTGTPVALFFVLLVAGLFSGRTAPTGILLMLSIVGVMGFVGLLVIDELVWSFVLLTGVLGLFVGKRFL